MPDLPEEIDPVRAAELLADWGFLVDPDLPDHPGPAYLLLAIRPEPTLRHYDPELVEYWVTGERAAGARANLSLHSRMPLEQEFSWGMITVVDRLGVSNEYLTFGGHLSAARIDDAVVAVFRSPAPLLRRGGHSQGYDLVALNVGGFFGRLRAAAGYVHGFEERASATDPVTRYAAFVAELVRRYRASLYLRERYLALWTILLHEEKRLRDENPIAWAQGQVLLAEAEAATSGHYVATPDGAR